MAPSSATLGVLDALTWYRATLGEAPSHAPLRKDLRVDVAIIGAGLTGLSAALDLAEQGVRTAVLEAGPIGWGATGRNGGQICTGYTVSMKSFEKHLGRHGAQETFAISEEAKALIRERCEKYDIDCALAWGYLICANKPSQMDDLKEWAEELAAYGYDRCRIIDKATLEAEHLGSRVYHGALVDPGAGHFHPLKYAYGLARAAEEAGARIFEHSPVLEVEEERDGGIVLSCAEGHVRCDHLIIAANAYLGRLFPRLARRILPVASYVIATEPLGEERARGLIKRNEAVADANFVVDYFRLTPDHRLLFGGRCSYTGWHPKDLAAFMRPRMLRVFPQLADAEIDFAWGGHIAITMNRMPDAGILGRQGRILYAQGYSGQGVALSGMMGRLMAERILGMSNRFELFTRIRHIPFPGGVLRRPTHALGMLYYRLKDLVG
ncbi:FAD-binding oxidoreductase [Thermopetrobacter sp. TC1]|uniref:NAD(P)/FAD-dependent oxidoreductase n=1 Tax=Thermopetrobacter sp. TC1 TaxID=1495045 RepID=UPI00068C9DFA|nr:FAD-binding oxidoreductase [Thermopetrobacter sp. TC1]